jgi:hypothetical protein
MADSLYTNEEERPCPPGFSFEGAKLAPSEAVLLYGDNFCPSLTPAWFGQEKLLRADCRVSAAGLSQAMWMAALLSLEAMGRIRFEIRQKVSRLPGQEKALYVAPLPSSPAWPIGSLERKVSRMLGQGIYEPRNLVFRLLEREASNAGFSTLSLVKDGLLERGLLTTTQSRRLAPLGFPDYKLVRRTLTMVPDRGIEELSRLLNSTDKVRVGLLSELRNSIRKGLATARYIRVKRAATGLVELAHGIAGLFH